MNIGINGSSYILQPVPVEQPSRAGKVPSGEAELVRSLAFGAEKWESYFGEVGVEPPLPPDIAAILMSPCPLWPGKTVGETHKLVLVPQTVNGALLTLDLLEQLIQRPIKGKTTKYRHYWHNLKKEHGSTSCSSHWILMTKDVIPGSRSQVYTAQQAQVAALLGGYQVPRLLEAAVCVLIEHVETGTRFFSDNPWTYNRCQERVDGYQTVVGGFAATGLNISTDFHGARARCGVAGLRIF